MSKLTSSAWFLLRKAEELSEKMGHDRLGLNHLLLAALERYRDMVEYMTGLDTPNLLKEIWMKLQSSEIGEEMNPEWITGEAVELARKRGKGKATERDIIAVALKRAGYEIRKPVKPTPVLKRFGRDLCKEADEGKLRRLVGRERELEVVMETLLRPMKRNPLLVGPAGVGKTAIVEGLAQRIIRGEVPEQLKGVKIYALQPSVLVAGTKVVGKLQERIKAIIKEASQEGVILFIDEIHTMVGAGGIPGLSDIASMLKPALSRGDFVCIGATTDMEYERFIRPDPALERRFLPIRVQELTPRQTIEVLESLSREIGSERGIKIERDVLELIVDLADRFLKNRFFPDKAIDIFDQCMGSASARGKKLINGELVREVVERMVGMPVRAGSELSETLQILPNLISRRIPVEEEAIKELAQRLNVTMRGLDIRPEKPNIVVLLLSEDESQGEEFAELLSEALFGAKRIVEEEMSRYKHPADLSWLTGAPPGYVGHDQPLSLHLKISQIPRSVLLLRNIDVAHPSLHSFLSRALESGFITDAHGRKAFLSDSIVVMTSASSISHRRRIGFNVTREMKDREKIAVELLGEDLGKCVDVVLEVGRPSQEWLKKWAADILLPNVTEKYVREGIEILWDESVIDWAASLSERKEVERELERNLSFCLSSYLGKEVRLKISVEGDRFLITPVEGKCDVREV